MKDNEKNKSKWLIRPQVRQGASLRLVCFPQAAGNAWSFRAWAERLPDAIELLAIQYPGHGDRLAEEARRDCDVLVGEIAEVLLPEMDRPYALLGHSMGAILAFETGRALQSMEISPAEHLFVSGYNAPGEPRVSDDEIPLGQLSDSQLIERIEALDCTPREVLDDPEMQALLVRMIRADSAVCESHLLRDRTPLASPITALGGVDDPRTTETGLAAWHAFTSGRFDIQWFDGNHGFLVSEEERVYELLVRRLLQGNGRDYSAAHEELETRRTEALFQRKAFERESN